MKKKIKIKTDVKFGKNCKIYEPANLYGCELGNNVTIGPFVEIQSNSRIADNSRISSHSFICSLVEIGKDCFVGHGVMFVNDKFINGKTSKQNNKGVHGLKKTKIGNNVLIGSNSTILPVNICGNVVIGAGSTVTKNITKPGVYMGNPAKYKKKI